MNCTTRPPLCEACKTKRMCQIALLFPTSQPQWGTPQRQSQHTPCGKEPPLETRCGPFGMQSIVCTASVGCGPSVTGHVVSCSSHMMDRTTQRYRGIPSAPRCPKFAPEGIDGAPTNGAVERSNQFTTPLDTCARLWVGPLSTSESKRHTKCTDRKAKSSTWQRGTKHRPGRLAGLCDTALLFGAPDASFMQ